MADSCFYFELMYKGEDADIAFFEKRLSEIWGGKVKSAELSTEEKKLKKALGESEDKTGNEYFEDGGSFANYEPEFSNHTLTVDTGDALLEPPVFLSPLIGAFPNLDFFYFQTFSCDTGRSFYTELYRHGERKYVTRTDGIRIIAPYMGYGEDFTDFKFYKIDPDYAEKQAIADRYISLCVNEWKKNFKSGKMEELHQANEGHHIFNRPEQFEAEYEAFIKKHSAAAAEKSGTTMSEKQALEMIEGGADLDDIPEELRTQEVCLAAVQKKPEPGKTSSPLAYVPENIITEEMCLIAVQQSGGAFAFVPSKFKTPEICRIAVQQDGFVFCYVPDILRTPELCHIAVKNFGPALEYVPAKLRTGEICIDAARSTPDRMHFRTGKPYLKHLFQWVPKKLRTIEIYRDMVIANKKLLKYLPAEVKGEVEAALKAAAEDKAATGEKLMAAMFRNSKGNKASAVGNYEDAVAEYTKAIELVDDYEYFNNRAIAFRNLGRYDEALADHNAAVHNAAEKKSAGFAISLSQEADLYRARANTYRAVGKIEEARADFEHSLTIEPDNANAKNALAELVAAAKANTAADVENGKKLSRKPGKLIEKKLTSEAKKGK